MGHTLEENGKWGSSRGWPGKDGIPPYAFSLSLSLFLLVSVSVSLPPSFSFSPSFHLPPCTRCSPAASSFLFHLPALLLILLHHPPPSSDILFRSLTLLSPRALPHPTELTEGALVPLSSVDTPMRATPRQGRCASHNGRRYRDSRVKREDRWTRE